MKRLVAFLPVAAAAAALLAPAVSSASSKVVSHPAKTHADHPCPFAADAAAV